MGIRLKHSLAKTCYRFFSTLSNPTRLAILEYLREGPKNVKQISESLGQEQSMISHNLKPLVECRFVFVERKWKERLYSINKETMEPIFKLFNFHAQKYCPTKGACPKDWRKRRDKFDSADISHH
jgi:DNA-binding transcriptional ArsR family regulator